VEVTNSTVINKSKESLNSGGNQFHRYQQNEYFSPELIEHSKD